MDVHAVRIDNLSAVELFVWYGYVYYIGMHICSLLLSNEVHRSHKCMDLISGMPTSRGRHKTTYYKDYKIVRSTRL